MVHVEKLRHVVAYLVLDLFLVLSTTALAVGESILWFATPRAGVDIH